MELLKHEVMKLQELIRTEGWGIFLDKLLALKKEAALEGLIKAKTEREDCMFKGQLEALKAIGLCVGFEIEQGSKK